MVEKPEQPDHQERQETRNTLALAVTGLVMLGGLMSQLLWNKLRGGKHR